MILDIGSFMFNMNITEGGGTPSWGTALGQGADHKFNVDGIDELCMGMLYCHIDETKIYCPLGKGGSDQDSFEKVAGALFEKIYVNGKFIKDARFVLLIIKDLAERVHKDRRTLKYNNKITYNGKEYNKECIEKIKSCLNLSNDAAWLVYSINIKNQDELHFSIIICDENKSLFFETTQTRKKYILDFLEKQSINIKNFEIKPEDFNDIFSKNRIIFGAPGTGKSYLLENESEVFRNQLSQNDAISKLTDLIKDIGTYSVESIGIGFNFADEIKESKISSIIDIFGCSNDQAYRISQGKRARSLMQDKTKNKFDDYNFNGNGLDQFLDNQIKKIDEKDIEISSLVFGYKYAELLFDLTSSNKIRERFSVTTTKARWINYGKKVKTLNYNLDNSEVKDFIERVTFYPNYSYSQFVGCYKPTMKENEESGEEEITYKFVPGPFIKVYERAKRNPKKNFLLIIEEINRANAPAVFGDIFQLLDRKNGVSEYFIVASEDLQNYLKSRGIDDYKILRIPSNMYIWATMNSADQGVQPLDTAFKRRWEFEYLDINGKIVDDKDGGSVEQKETLDKLKDAEIPFDEKNYTTWGEFREKLNEHLLENCNVHEDKCLGPFFVGEKIIKNAKDNEEEFHKTFKSKILMYLFEDVVKMNPSKLFVEEAGRTYSAICKKYDEVGLGIFKFANKLDKHLKEDKKSEEIKPTTESNPNSN